MSRYQTRDVDVRGGPLHVGIWDSDDVAAGATPEQIVLAAHGVTSSHRAWSLVAEGLTRGGGVRFIAPDLRGRGRSSSLPSPYGMPQHARDLLAVLDALDVAEASVVGHSMGGYVAIVFAHLFGERTSSLLLVDGGVPLPAPPPTTSEREVVATRLGPAAARLSMTFASSTDYREFWRDHPALGPAWSDAIRDYVDYDLVGAAPELHSSCRYEAVFEDSAQLVLDGTLLAAWEGVDLPIELLRAPLGLMAEPPGLYPPAMLRDWQRRIPNFHWREIAGVNHYTITLGPIGAAEVVEELIKARGPAVTATRVDGTA